MKLMPDQTSSLRNRNGFTTFMRTERGFTLIELLVTISIIAVLSSIGLIVYQGVQSKARDSIRKSDLQKLAIALEIYAQQPNGLYVREEASEITTCPQPTDNTSTFYTNIASDMSDGVVPKDPKDNTLYCYLSTNGSTYTLCANLENTSDPDIDNRLCPGYNYGLVPR